MDRRERLIVPRGMAAAMLRHARAELPNEACGLVAGDRTTGLATAFHPTRNEYLSPLRYSVDPEDLVGVVLNIESRGEELLAIFHSHVDAPPVPSAADTRGAHAYPAVLHLVASMTQRPWLRAWRVDDGPTEIELVMA